MTIILISIFFWHFSAQIVMAAEKFKKKAIKNSKSPGLTLYKTN